jgi:hypothetical protein
MKKFSGILIVFAAIVTFAGLLLTSVVGCGGGGSTPTPTPTPSQVFANDQSLAQSPPVKLGTSGGNSQDLGTKVCCIGTLGSLWTKTGVTNPVILSNNHVLNRSDKGVAGEAINQPLQLVCTATGAPAPLTVAHLTQGATLKPIANEPTGPCASDTQKAALCGHSPSNVDAAIAEIVAGQVDGGGTILDFGAVGTSSIAAAQPSATIGTATLGETVGKSGRTTGLTCSTIQSLNTTVLINYDGTCGDDSNGVAPAFTSYFNNQIVIAGGAFSSGGDSGSLIVDTNTSRPVALLYGGSNVSTTANPIQDVITAFGGGAAFTIVGGGDHSISCAHQATASATQVGTTQSALVPAERQRVAAVQRARSQALTRDFGIASVDIGPSGDNPKEGALILHVSGKSVPAVPAMIDGVRTRLVFDDPGFAAPAIGAQQIGQATTVKEAHLLEFIGKGIQGVGVAVSSDNPAETAISFYVIQGQAHPAIPAVIDGIRTKVIEGTPFKTY